MNDGTTYEPKVPVETKVKVATAASYFGGVGLLAILQAVSQDADLISGLPDAIEVFLVPLVTSAITFIGGYVANHTWRGDRAARPVNPLHSATPPQ